MSETTKEAPMEWCMNCSGWHREGVRCPHLARLRVLDDAFQSTERVLMGDDAPTPEPR